jgi:hypothetical protein
MRSYVYRRPRVVVRFAVVRVLARRAGPLPQAAEALAIASKFSPSLGSPESARAPSTKFFMRSHTMCTASCLLSSANLSTRVPPRESGQTQALQRVLQPRQALRVSRRFIHGAQHV